MQWSLTGRWPQSERVRTGDLATATQTMHDCWTTLNLFKVRFLQSHTYACWFIKFIIKCVIKVKKISCPTVQITTSLYMLMVRKAISVCVRVGTSLNLQVCWCSTGIHIVEVVAGVRVTTATEEGFAIALTNTGDVYSWGKSYRGRLGHPTADNQRTPKLVEALAGKDCKQVNILNSA